MRACPRRLFRKSPKDPVKKLDLAKKAKRMTKKNKYERTESIGQLRLKPDESIIWEVKTITQKYESLEKTD